MEKYYRKLAKGFLAGTFVILLSSALWAAIEEELSDLDNIKGSSLSKLPDHIKAPEGKLSLIADFDNKVDGRVPVYVINRTGICRDVQLIAVTNDGQFQGYT